MRLTPQLHAEKSFQRVHNIACWHRSAVGLVAPWLSNDPELWRQAVDAPFGIRRQLAEGVTGDYLWFEQSLDWTDCQTAVCTNRVTLPVDFDGLELELTFVVHGPFTLTRARSPDVPPRERESQYLELMDPRRPSRPASHPANPNSSTADTPH